MFVVVLWSDQLRNRAVIWCEDHGDLAFFNGDGLSELDGADMDPGDLVHFYVSEDRHMRLARNPKLVASDEYPTLAHELKKAGAATSPPPAPRAADADAKIIAFEPKSKTAETVRRSALQAV